MEKVEDGAIYRIADNEVIGITITDFKARTLKIGTLNRVCGISLHLLVDG